VAVPLIDRRVGGEQVEVLAAVDVPHPGAFASLDDDVQRVVVVSAIAVLELDEPVGAGSVLGIGGL